MPTLKICTNPAYLTNLGQVGENRSVYVVAAKLAGHQCSTGLVMQGAKIHPVPVSRH